MSDTECLELLRALISTPSPNPPGDISACTRIVSRVLEAEAIPYSIFESESGVTNLVAWLKARTDDLGRTLMVNAHLDVIPPGDGWERDPYDPVYEHGYVWGRGSCDMKAGVVSAIATMVSLKRSLAPLGGTLMLALVGDEERAGELGTQYLLKQGITADLAICCEPTELRCELGNRGLLWVDVLVRGKASHGGYPHLGVNAIHATADIIRELEKIPVEQFRNEMFEVAVGSVCCVHVQGGARLNVIPDTCSLSIDRRLMPGEAAEMALRQIAQAVTRATGIVPGVDRDSGEQVVLWSDVMHEACWTPEESEIAQSYKRCFERVTGRKPPAVRGKAPATDASHLVHMAGIPTIICGPGDCSLAHTDHERVRFSEVLQAKRLYCEMALDLLR